MSPRDLTPEQIATIDHRLDQTFSFIRDVIDDPVILEEIPDGSTLRFSDVAIGNTVIRLTAYPDAGPSWSWTARITGPAEWAAAGRKPINPLPNEPEDVWERFPTQPAHGQSAEEALSALEEKLRDMPHLLEVEFRVGRRTA